MKPHLERLFRYVAWADRKSIEMLRTAPDTALAEALPLFAHILAAEHVWLRRLLDREPQHPVWPTLTLADCEQLAADNEAGYRSFLDSLADDQLTTMKHYRNAAGQEFATPIIDILLQVITHGGYHRGQIAKLIGKAGGTVAFTDFIFFAREGN